MCEVFGVKSRASFIYNLLPGGGGGGGGLLLTWFKSNLNMDKRLHPL